MVFKALPMIFANMISGPGGHKTYQERPSIANDKDIQQLQLEVQKLKLEVEKDRLKLEMAKK